MVDLNNLCLDILYELHKSDDGGEDYEDYEEIVKSVVGDMLMNNIIDDKVVLTYDVHRLIGEFYKYAQKMYEKYHYELGCTEYVVYRATNTSYIRDDGIAIQPIPFSTSIDRENVDTWLRGSSNCCIWKIHFPINTRFLGVNNKEEGREVVLPAGILRLLSSFIDKRGIVNYVVKFEPCNTIEEMYKLQKKYGYSEEL